MNTQVREAIVRQVNCYVPEYIQENSNELIDNLVNDIERFEDKVNEIKILESREYEEA